MALTIPAGSAKTSAAIAPARTACQSRLTQRSSWPADRTEGARQAELSGIEDPVRIERPLHVDECLVGVAERIGHEARPVQPDAVVMAERAAGCEHRSLSCIPQRRV